MKSFYLAGPMFAELVRNRGLIAPALVATVRWAWGMPDDRRKAASIPAWLGSATL